MAMDRAVLDTDILSDVFKRRNTVVRRAEEYLHLHGRFTISCITVLEVVAGWHRLQRENRVQEFLEQLPDFEYCRSTRKQQYSRPHRS